MKVNLKYVVFTLALVLVQIMAIGQTLVVKISNIENRQKPLRIGLYNTDKSFPNENKPWKALEQLPSKSGETIVTFSNIPYGTYAIAVYQDENTNQKMDTNIVGYPSEPFGFSKNFVPRFSAPDFSDCSVYFNNKTTTFSVRLID